MTDEDFVPNGILKSNWVQKVRFLLDKLWAGRDKLEHQICASGTVTDLCASAHMTTAQRGRAFGRGDFLRFRMASRELGDARVGVCRPYQWNQVGSLENTVEGPVLT